MIDAFISEFREKLSAYELWAEFITSEIVKSVKDGGREPDEFFKVPPKKRIKQESSIRGKAGRYRIVDFKAEIRDLVGVRFVVLLTSELQQVEDAIKSNPAFCWDKIRDYGVQTDSNPELFEYQSIHYVVSPAKELLLQEQIIDQSINCEIQIRTLLQHAYAELTHDNIYKPIQVVPSSARRLVARSMALMETTDELFCGTLNALRQANGPRNEFLAELSRQYSMNVSSVGELWDSKINFEIIDMFWPDDNLSDVAKKVERFSLDRDSIFEVIRSRRESMFLFAQPVILFLYYLVGTKQDEVREKWIFLSLVEELRLVFSDLNIAFGDEL